MTNANSVVFERTGEVRDLSGARVGTYDPDQDAKDLRTLHRYVGDVSRGRVSSNARDVAQASDDLRALAAPQGDIGQADAQTPGTAATYVAGALECIADAVCPVTLVNKTIGSLLFEDVANDLAQAVSPQVNASGSSNILNPKLAKLAYDASSTLSLSVEMPSEVFDNSDIDLLKTGIRRLVNAFKLDREVRIATLLTTSAKWPASNVTAAATKWNTIATATPLLDVFAALAKSYIQPTALVFSEAVSQYFFQNTAVYQYLTAGELAEGTSPMPKPIIAKLRQISAGAVSYVWGSTPANAILVYAPDEPGVVATARTVRFIGDAPDKIAAQEANGYMLRSFFNAKHGGRGSRSLVLAANDADQFMNGNLGGIITGVVA